MEQKLHRFLCLILCIGILLPAAQAQVVNFEDTWKQFLSDNKTSNVSKLVKPPKEQMENYLKYTLMYANAHFCANEINNAEDMIGEIRQIGTTKYDAIPGYKAKFDDLALKTFAYHDMESLWLKFLPNRNVSLQDLADVPDAKRVCEKGTLAKYSYITTWDHYCNGDIGKAKGSFENRLMKLINNTSLNVKDVQGLEPEVEMLGEVFAGLKRLGPAWKEFMDTEVSPGFEKDFPLMECYSIPTMKVYVLRAAVDVCKLGSEMLEKINKLKESNTHTIPSDLADKIKWLEKESGNFDGDMDQLNAAWKEFVPTDNLTKKYNIAGEFCHKDAQIKAYVMDGTINPCEKGAQRLKDIEEIRAEFDPELDATTLKKIKNLEEIVANLQGDIATLNSTWEEFIQNGDTLLRPHGLADYYCDPIAQTKSWVIKGRKDVCENGEPFLRKIAGLKKKHSLKYDAELACQVQRLQQRVWDCRYWELVQQARRETHAERERFGPQSAGIMQGALNSDKLPCNTTVQYIPLGNLGIKYTISTFLCQNIDLAKMGDPEYYRKIATWVNTEVLTKYCEANMRCKKDFFIYLEGHTDGHPFGGATYKNSLNIPQGTSYTHFLNGQAMDKTTTRLITTSLKNNTELGIARAWTVKQQLDFMGVPISIGAWEHPVTEKGGTYRRIEIVLNITNLLLDFYEKRLKELIDKSGIGKRPADC